MQLLAINVNQNRRGAHMMRSMSFTRCSLVVLCHTIYLLCRYGETSALGQHCRPRRISGPFETLTGSRVDSLQGKSQHTALQIHDC